MKSKNASLLHQKKVFAIVGIVTICILLIPLIAMQFSREVVWSASDFIIAGLLLFGMGSLFILVARRIKTHKLLLGIIFIVITLYIWAELAVGVFTSLGD